MANEDRIYQNKYGNIYLNEDLVTPKGRLIYPYIAEPNVRYKPSKYSVTILFDKDETPKDELNALIKVCKELKSLAPKNYKCSYTYGALRDGDEELNKEGEVREQFKNKWFIKASCSNKPTCIESKNGAHVPCDETKLVAGVLVRALVQPMLFDSGFAWQLKLVQFVKDDGTRYSFGRNPIDSFAALSKAFSDDDEETVEEVEEMEEAEVEEVEEAPAKKTKVKSGKNAELEML